MAEWVEKNKFSKKEVYLSRLLIIWVIVVSMFLIIPIVLSFESNHDVFIWMIFFVITGIISVIITMGSTNGNYEVFRQRLNEILFEKSFEQWVELKEIENAQRKQILEDLENIGSNYFSKIHSPGQVADRMAVLNEYKTVASAVDNDKSREKLVGLVEKKFPKEFRGVKTSYLVKLRNQHSQTRNKLNSLVSFHNKKLLELDRQFSKWDDLLELLQSFREGIPVNLQRISQLIELDEVMTEKLLKLILDQESEIGEYLELEQSFIKGSFQNLSLFKQEKLETAVKASYQICNNCKSEVDLLLKNCPNCNHILPRCDVCKQGFRINDKIQACPICNRNFHYIHLHEIVRISGKCPTCKSELKEDQIYI